MVSGESVTSAVPPVALLTYSTKPRGGVVHTLALGEALHAVGVDVRVVGLGDPQAGFFRPVRAPVTVVPAPPPAGSLEERVEQSTSALAEVLPAVAEDYRVLHAQDCIAARAVTRARAAGVEAVSVRTVHHVDDFTSAVLMDCQRQAIIEPDVVLTVSEWWRRTLAEEYGVDARVVRNGVDTARFATVPDGLARRLRARVAPDRPLLLSVGGIEPRKGSVHLVRAVAEVARRSAVPPVLAVIGGHSFQDHRAYREAVLASLPGLGLTLGRDVVELGTVPDEDVPGWYAAADALAFPSTKEGFGLAVLEAMSARLPVVTSDLPVFREYLHDERDALLVPVGDEHALADALLRMLSDDDLRRRLVAGGAAVVRRFTWHATAEQHADLYAALLTPDRGR
jgi:glycosyltransferase-like protein